MLAPLGAESGAEPLTKNSAAGAGAAYAPRDIGAGKPDRLAGWCARTRTGVGAGPAAGGAAPLRGTGVAD